MSWVKLDDRVWSHRKFAKLSGEAARLWMFALCWANAHGTDGMVPEECLPMLRGTSKQARELVATGLWHDHEGGWKIHDYLDYQPGSSRDAQVKEANRERVQRHRAKSNGYVTHYTEEPVMPCNSPPSRPVPSRPDPVLHTTALPKDLTGIQTEKARRPPAVAEAAAIVGTQNQPQSPLEVAKPAEVVPTPKAQPWQPQEQETQAGPWRPRNRAEANAAHITARCEWALREQWAAAEYEPQKWPEVVAVAQAFSGAFRLAEQKLGRLDGDRHGTLRLVTLLTQYTPEQLTKAIEALPDSKWVKDKMAEGERPRLGWLSDEVVRTAFGGLKSEREVSPRVKQLLEEQRRKDAEKAVSA